LPLYDMRLTAVSLSVPLVVVIFLLLEEQLVEYQRCTDQASLVGFVCAIRALHLERVCICKQLGGKVGPDLGDLRVWFCLLARNLARAGADKCLFLCATWGIDEERNAAVAAPLGAAVDAHTTATGGHVDIPLVVSSLDLVEDVESRDAEPHRLLDSTEIRPTTIARHDLLIAAALAITHVAPEGPLEFVNRLSAFWTVLLEKIGIHPCVPWAGTPTAKPHHTAAFLVDHGDVSSILIELELTVGFAAEALLNAALSRLSDDEL